MEFGPLRTAQFRLLSDLRESVAHSSALFHDGLRYAQQYARWLFPREELESTNDLSVEQAFDEHLRDRHPWSMDPSGLRSQVDLLRDRAPLVVYTICANASVIFTLRRLSIEHQIPLDIRCNHITPTDYLPLSQFRETFDFCITEASIPARQTRDLQQEFKLCFTMHRVREALVAAGPFVKNVFTVANTSTKSHYKMTKTRLGAREHELPTLQSCRSVLGTLADHEGVFMWDPWLWAITEIQGDRFFSDFIQYFPMAVFASRNAWQDLDRRKALLALSSLLIWKWNTVRHEQNEISLKSMELLDFGRWKETFEKALLIVHPEQGVDSLTQLELRRQVIDDIELLWTRCKWIDGYIDELNKEITALRRWTENADSVWLTNASKVLRQLASDHGLGDGEKIRCAHDTLVRP